MNSHSPRIAVVTGAAQGIGRVIALRLADEGLDVAVNDVASKTDELQELVSQIQARGGRSLAVPADVSVEGDVEVMITKVVQEFGRLDVMVANAGLAFYKTLIELPIEDFDKIVAVNIRGVMLCYKHAAIQMIQQGKGGRIVGASSVAGKQAVPMMSAYCATKFAIRGLTQSAALELSKYGITVNCYAPGLIKTTLTSGITNRSGGVDLWKALELPPNVPVGEPEVIASLVSYLIKPEAYFITGEYDMVSLLASTI